MLRSARPLCGPGQNAAKRCKADEALLNSVLTAGSRGYVIDTKLQNLAQAAKVLLNSVVPKSLLTCKDSEFWSSQNYSVSFFSEFEMCLVFYF